MAYVHGLRVSELIALKISDIDFSESAIYIKRLKMDYPQYIPCKRNCSVIKKWLALRDNIVKNLLKTLYFFLVKEIKYRDNMCIRCVRNIVTI